MTMKKHNVIFDIGANDGLDGLGLALINPKYYIYAFEANPEMLLKITKNKKIIENYFQIKISNYEIINKAVADYNGNSNFNISQYDLCSSLLPYKFVETKKKISCEVITLEKFCLDRKIDNIIHIHVDTQGSDLSVLKGLFSYRKNVHSGVMETMIDVKDVLYEGGSTYKDVKLYFKEWNFNIFKTEFNNFDKKEINVYFLNTLIYKKNIITFKKLKKRFLYRVIKDKSNLKDYMYMLYLKMFRI